MNNQEIITSAINRAIQQGLGVAEISQAIFLDNNNDYNEYVTALSILELLLTHSALQTLSSRESFNFSSLAYAIQNRDMEAVQVFVQTIHEKEKGSYIDYASRLAIQYRQSDIVPLLLKNFWIPRRIKLRL